MKNFLAISILLVFIIVCTGCSLSSDQPVLDSISKQEHTKQTDAMQSQGDYGAQVFPKFSESFVFSTGAGAWGTVINIDSDGSFSGNYHDSEMGLTGEKYPHGTVYICDFFGRFENIEKINDYTYSAIVTDLNRDPVGEESIKNDIKYITCEAYGIENATMVNIYTPDAPVSKLPEAFVSSIPKLSSCSDTDMLGFYALYNIDEQIGFSSNNK